METLILAGDSRYTDAINYDGTNYYNWPVTVTIDEVKYVLPFGSSDSIYSHKQDNFIYLIGENKGLGYISCVLIDSKTKEILQDVFINNVEEHEFTENIFDLDTPEQINVLSEYFQ